MSTEARIGASGLPTHGVGAVGPLAARLGLNSNDAAAARRHAHRLESRGELGAALEAWRIAMFVESSDARVWAGLARCVRAAGLGSEADAFERVEKRLKENGGSHAT